jgi:ABC-2 type transport system permease protein
MTSSIAAYRAVLSARFASLLQYRAAAVAGLTTQVFWGAIRMMAFTAFYRSSTQSQPMPLEDAITYIWLGQALFALLPWRPDEEVEAMVRSGDIVYELVKPVDLYSLWYMRSVAARTAPTLLRSIPLLVIAGALFGMGPPASLGAAALFVVGLAGAVALSAAIMVLLTVTVVHTISGRGIVAIIGAAVSVLSGMIVPLQLFPDWAKAALAWQPFRGIMDTPFRLYLGSLRGIEAGAALAHQLVWTLVLVALGWLLLEGAKRRLVVQGG